MSTCLGKSCSFGLPRVPFVNCCQFMYLVISLLVLRAGCWIIVLWFKYKSKFSLPKIAYPAIVYAEIVVVIDLFFVGVCP